MTEGEKKAIDNLIEYVKEDEIYNGTRENLSDFDKFCIEHCIDIVIVLKLIKKQQSELEKKNKIIDLMVDFIRERSIYAVHSHEDLKQYFERKVK